MLLSGVKPAHAQTPTEPTAPATPTVPAATQTPKPEPRVRPTAIALLGADGTTYFRSGIRPAEADTDKLAAVPWLTQRSPDSLARVLPDGGGILVRRDRRAPDGTVLQNLYLIKPAPGTGVVEEPVPLDTAAFAQSKGLEGWRLRSISGLQAPRGESRVLLRLTFDKSAETTAPAAPLAAPTGPASTSQVPTEAMKAPDATVSTPDAPDTLAAAAPQATVQTREFLGWYEINGKSFTPIFEEPRLLGVEISPDGRFVHVLALRAGETGEVTALLLKDDGTAQETPVLDALRTVGYLYRGWVSGQTMLLKKAGQNQLVIYDVIADTVRAPKGLAAFAASVAPEGNFAVTWPGASEDTEPIVATLDGSPVAVPLEDSPAIAEWSADGRFALLLGARNDRRQATRAWLLETEGTPRLREIVLPAPISAARFLYEAL